jgi:hypothetical protein
MNEPFVLPSLEEVEQMEKQRSQAIEALEISDGFVKCQRCSSAVPIVGKPSRSHNDRVVILQRRIKWLEDHYYSQHLGANTNGKNETIKAVREELADLLKADAAYDKLRGLPLYSCKITRYKYVCSTCYEKAYRSAQRKGLLPAY